MMSYTEEDFAAFDENADGLLSVEEMYVHETGKHDLRKSMAELIRVADSDESGDLSAQEVEEIHDYLIGMEAHEHLHQWANHMDL